MHVYMSSGVTRVFGEPGQTCNLLPSTDIHINLMLNISWCSNKANALTGTLEYMCILGQW